MGDSGSMLIGLVLSASAITLTGQFDPDDISKGAMGAQASFLVTLLPVLLPLSILVVPLADLVLAVVRRTRPGARRCRPTSSTCTTGCWRSATPSAARSLIMWMWAGTHRLRHGAGQPLHRPAGCGSRSAAMFALTLTMTFVLPVVRRPALLDREQE